MHTVRGSFKDGVAKPDEPVQGHEGQPVLITFLDDSQKTIDEFVAEGFPSIEEVVARIVARGPSKDYEPPTESLAEVLASDFGIDVDPTEWDRQWAEVEAEINRIQREDDRAEGLL
jgi:hypothetical protein